MITFGELESISNMDPATLVPTRGDAWAQVLYEKFADELAGLTAEMVGHRRALVESGYSCDFSDRESELLYLLIRALKPEIVVEISPCHGYSTNYILAALTHNGRGELHSYEIVEWVHGKPIEQVIRDNQLPWVDMQRLHIHVGDATKASIPAPDFLFIDSAHEAWFASWYFQQLVPRAKVCMVHDIVIDQLTRRTLVPKGPFMGIRESLHVLKTLALNGQPVMSVAAFGRTFDVVQKDRIHTRYPGGPERSVIFLGHDQKEAATRLHGTIAKFHSWQHRVIDGDRSVMKEVQAIADPAMPWFARLSAASLFSLGGYREEAMRAEFPDYHESLMRGLGTELVSVSDFVAALEVGTQLGSVDLVSGALAKARQCLPVSLIRFYADHYREFGISFNTRVACLARFVSRASTRLGL